MLFVVDIESLKALGYHALSKKTLVLSITCSKCENGDEKVFKEDESIWNIKERDQKERMSKKHKRVVQL